jgi:predicted glycoside hydrolase/deacetylase ChbG (UPF0249 family)
MPISRAPSLIVNADDLGWNREATDRTIEAFRAGRITSSTAMVYMEDSDRAAALAKEVELPVGLHLNLTDPYTAGDLPDDLRQRHSGVCEHFSGRGFRLRSWLFDPRIQAEVEAAVADQLRRFEDLYGRPPTHVDGHNHVHSCPNVALASPLRAVDKMRNALWSWPGTRSSMGLVRAVRRAATYRRKLTTRYFFDVWELFRDRDEVPMAERLAPALETSVEVMAHPGFEHEWEALTSAPWGELLDRFPRGSYGDLRRPQR